MGSRLTSSGFRVVNEMCLPYRFEYREIRNAVIWFCPDAFFGNVSVRPLTWGVRAEPHADAAFD